MKTALPKPVPSVMTTSSPLPLTTAAPCTSASLATLVGMLERPGQGGGQIEIRPGGEQVAVER